MNVVDRLEAMDVIANPKTRREEAVAGYLKGIKPHLDRFGEGFDSVREDIEEAINELSRCQDYIEKQRKLIAEVAKFC